MKVIRNSGNVFADIGFTPREAETLAVKSDLAALVAHAIARRGLSLQDAARACSTAQATLSKALAGKLQGMTIDRLVRWLVALGWNVTITAEPRNAGRRNPERGEITVSVSGPET